MRSVKNYLKTKPAKAIKIMRIEYNIKESRRMQFKKTKK
jgi:hypothetical protein